MSRKSKDIQAIEDARRLGEKIRAQLKPDEEVVEADDLYEIATTPPSPLDDIRLIAITTAYPGYWGKGKSIGAALKELRKQSGSTPRSYVVYMVHKDTVVNGLGNFCYPLPYHPVAIHRVPSDAAPRKAKKSSTTKETK